MADLKISQLNSLAGGSLANNDELAIVDTSASETKKITSKELVQYGYGLVDASTLDGDVIEPGTTSARGTVQLTDSTSSTSTTTAATPNAVKGAYDLANAALPKSGGTMTGQILADDSTSASTPGYAFDGDPNTGLLRAGADELALVTGGSARLTIDASGNVVVPGNFTVSGTTTTIDTTTLLVEDKNIEMGVVGTPTDTTADGGGITLKGTTDKTINWVDATNAWTSSEIFDVPAGTAATPSLIFGSDVNTGIYSPGADQLAISTNGSGRLFVDASGRVGIGGTPAVPLNVLVSGSNPGSISSATALMLTRSGTAGTGVQMSLIGGSTSTVYLNFGDTDSESPGQIYYNNLTEHLGIATNGSERLRITSDGKLGLGTSSPTSLFVSDRKTLANPDAVGATTAANAAFQIAASTNTNNRLFVGIGSNARPYIQVQSTSTNVTESLIVNPLGGNVGIGTQTPGAALDVRSRDLHLGATSGGAGLITFRRDSGAQSGFFGWDSGSDLVMRWSNDSGSGRLAFNTNSQERMRLDESGRLLVGTSTSATGGQLQLEGTGFFSSYATVRRNSNDTGMPAISIGKSRGTSAGSVTIVQSGDPLGRLAFTGADGTNNVEAATIESYVDGTPGANDMPGRLVFSTTADGAASPTERMRITSQGYVFVDSSSSALQGSINTTNTGLKVVSTTNTVDSKIECFATVTDTRYGIVFSNSNGIVGSISTNGSATAFNTSSDYRLKENVVPLTGAADRLNQLQVHRFNFIADPDKTVDGFIAHEAQAVVPECVTGTKDEVDADGNPVYQGIDQSKLVPLLTAALQEAIGRIETLEAEVAALKGA